MALLNGVFIETPGHIGPFRRSSDGALYFIAEKDPTPNHRPYVYKSTDNGLNWAIADEADTPTAADLEGFDVHRVGDVLHMFHHRSDTQKYYYAFDMATDQWSIAQEFIENGNGGTVLVQNIAGARRSDGTTVAFWVNATTPNQIVYSIRSSGGVWGSPQTITESSACTGVMGVLDSNDVYHFVYFRHGDTNIIYRTLSATDVLSGATDIGDSFVDTGVHCPTLPAVKYGEGTGERVVMSWIDASFHIMMCEIQPGQTPPAAVQITTRPVVTEVQPVNDSDQPTAQLFAHSTGDLTLVYADRTNRSEIWMRWRRRGTWKDIVRVARTQDAGPQWIRGEVYEDNKSVCFFHDDDSQGGATPLLFRIVEDRAWPFAKRHNRMPINQRVA